MTGLPEVGWNAEIGALVVKVTENWIVGVTPMLFNDRVILMEHSSWQFSITSGFCYDKGGAAGLAAMAWDPETEHLPLGFKKLAYDGRPAPAERSTND